MENALITSSILLWLIVLCNLLLTLALIRRVNDSSQRALVPDIGLKTGQTAPDFTAQTLTDEIVNLNTYLGRKVAFLFISTRCDPCRKILPEIMNLAPKAARAGVEFVLVSGSPVEDTHSFVKEFDIHLPVLIAPRARNPFLEEYKAIGTPYYCIINQQGKVQATGYPNWVGGEWQSFAESWAKNEEMASSKERR